MHALLIIAADRNRAVLETTLAKLGLGVTIISIRLAGRRPGASRRRVDLVFLDVDMLDGSCARRAGQCDFCRWSP